MRELKNEALAIQELDLFFCQRCVIRSRQFHSLTHILFCLAIFSGCCTSLNLLLYPNVRKRSLNENAVSPDQTITYR